MKVDLSTIFLVVLCVIPGLFAQRGRNSVCPRSYEDQGASSELGELVALGISTHGLIVVMFAIGLLSAGTLRHLKPLIYFQKLDRLWPFTLWLNSHAAETIVVGALYVFVSFAVSHALGIVYGIWRYKQSPITNLVLTRAKLYRRVGIGGLLSDRPIAYQVLNPMLNAKGVAKSVFVELEMKDKSGSYAGQLSQFSVVRDEEPHKLIFIIQPFFKKLDSDNYTRIATDGVMLDLADVSALRVRQV